MERKFGVGGWPIHHQSTLYTCCRLFDNDPNRSNLAKPSGFDHWKKLNPQIVQHENGPVHHKCLESWVELEMRLKSGKTMDAAIEQAASDNVKKWRNILKRILDCVLYLARQNQALKWQQRIIRR